MVNSKDQAARLYDLRKMKSWSEFESEPDAVVRYGAPRYDCKSTSAKVDEGIAHALQTGARGTRRRSGLHTQATAR